jgi:hypothetical protein
VSSELRVVVMQLASAAFDEDDQLVCDVDGLGCGRELILKPSGRSPGRPFVDTYDEKQHAGNQMVFVFLTM